MKPIALTKIDCIKKTNLKFCLQRNLANGYFRGVRLSVKCQPWNALSNIGIGPQNLYEVLPKWKLGAYWGKIFLFQLLCDKTKNNLSKHSIIMFMPMHILIIWSKKCFSFQVFLNQRSNELYWIKLLPLDYQIFFPFPLPNLTVLPSLAKGQVFLLACKYGNTTHLHFLKQIVITKTDIKRI